MFRYGGSSWQGTGITTGLDTPPRIGLARGRPNNWWWNSFMERPWVIEQDLILHMLKATIELTGISQLEHP